MSQSVDARCALLHQQLARRLQRGLTDRIFSAAQLEVGHLTRGPLVRIARGQTAWPELVSDRRSARSIDDRSRFDVASVTKAAATSLLVMRAIEAGHLALDDRLDDLLSPVAFVPKALGAMTLESLLAHRSGLLAWRPFFESVPAAMHATRSGLEHIRAQVLATLPEAPVGVRERYSDLGYILLAWILETRCGASMRRLFEREIAAPLGLDHSRFVDVAGGEAAIDAVCTEIVDWRGACVCGVVHDGNTWSMGGCSGHAGLFSTAEDLGILARRLLSIDAGDDTSGWLSTSTLQYFWSPERRAAEGHFLLGWDQPSGAKSGAGQRADRTRTVGHLGFTGASLWIDRSRRAYITLLTNRVHPTRSDDRLRAFRPPLHDDAWEAIDEMNL